MADRAKELDGQLGWIERGWRSARNMAKEAWDAFANIGRPTTVADQADIHIQRLEEKIKANRELLASRNQKPGKATAELEQQLESAKALSQLSVSAGKAVGEAVETENKARQTGIDLQRESARYEKDSVKMTREISAAQLKYGELAKTDANARKELETLIGGIRERYTKKGGSGSRAGAISVTDNDLANIRSQLASAQQYYEQLQTLGVGATTLNAAERESLKIAEQLKLASNAKTVARLKEKQSLAEVWVQQLRTNTGLEGSLKEHQKSIDTNVKDADAIAQRARQQEAANAVFGKGQLAIEQMTLATLQHQMAEAQGSDRFDPKYIESLQLKIEAQQQWTQSLEETEKKQFNAHADDLLLNAQAMAVAYEDELRLSNATGLERERIVAQRAVELKYAKERNAVDRANISDEEKSRRLRKLSEAEEIESAATVSKATGAYMAKASDDINRSLTDALLRGFESGKDFAQNFADTLKNMFNTMVLRPVISAIMAPASGAINGVVQGGMNAVGLGGGNDLMGMASNASSIYSAFTGNSVMGNAASSVGGWLGLGGAATGTGLVAGAGSGMALAGTSAGLGLTGAATGTGVSLGLAGGGGLGLTAGSAGAGAIGAGIGTSAAATGGAAAAGSAGITGALAAVPVWGWAALAVLAVLGSGAFSTRGANHSGGVYSSAGQGWNDSASLLMGKDRGDALGDFTQRGNAELGSNVQKAVTGLMGVYEQLAGAVGSDRKIDVVAGFAANGKHKDEDSYGYYKILDKVSGQVLADYRNRELGKDDAAWQKYVAELGVGIVQQLRGTDIPKWVDDMLVELGESPTLQNLAAAVQEINAAQAALKQFGKAMPEFAAQSDAALSALMEAAGGRQALMGQLNSFYSNYFSESERTAVATAMVTEELDKLGYAMPTSRDQFRSWVTAAVDSGTAGAGSAAGLLKLESAVAQLLPAVETTAAGITQTLQGLLDQRVNLESELMRAQGNSDGYAAAQRAIAIKGYSEAEVAAWDYNQALQAQVTALDAAAERSRALTEERSGLETDMLRALGDAKGYAAAQRDIATAGYSEAEKKAWNYNQALQAQIRALDEAAQMQLEMSNIMGTASQSMTDVLQSLVERVQATSAFRANLGTAMESARLQSMDMGGQASYLRSRESALWSQLNAGADNAVELGEQLQKTFLDRISIEAQLRSEVQSSTVTSLQEQLSYTQAIQSAALSMRDTVDGLRLGSSSMLNPYSQLQYVSQRFEQSYAKASADPTDIQAWRDVQSYGTTYVQSGRDNWASSPQGVAIFDRVTGAMDQLMSLGLNLDPEIEAKQQEITLLQSMVKNTDQNRWAADQQLAEFAKLESFFQKQGQDDKANVEKQLDLMRQSVNKATQLATLSQTQINQSIDFNFKAQAREQQMITEFKRMATALAQMERAR